MKNFILITTLILIVMPSNIFAEDRLSLGYIYSSSKTHSEIIENTKDSINVVSPTCLDLNEKGRLEVNGLISKEFIEEMHSKNIKVTPFLSNHWGRKRAEKALDNPNVLIEDVEKVIIEYNLDGVNVDFENISVDYKDKLTNFIKLLRERLPKEKTISVAVAANPERLETTWVASYDYEGLSEYANYLVLMAYDEHCQGGSQGAVASIGFVQKSLDYILETVSKDKIVLGIPLYGRFWKAGEERGGEAIVIGQVENLIKKYKLVPTFDNETMTPKLTIEIDGVMTNAYVNGRYLEEGTYNIWYENEHSIKTKLKLINDYNLLGAGLWALDNEGIEFWDYYKTALNETEYEDEQKIRVRQRAEAYEKIVKVEEIIVEAYIPWEIEKEIDNSDFVEKIDVEEYKCLEVIMPESIKAKVKNEKILIKSYAKTQKESVMVVKN